MPPLTLTPGTRLGPYEILSALDDVSRDGHRFLMMKEGVGETQSPPPSLVVVQNWFEELKRLVPAR